MPQQPSSRRPNGLTPAAFANRPFDDHPGFVSIFDGQTLKDRVGDRALWRIENRVIVSESTREKPSGNSDISYQGIVAKDFDLKLEINVEKGGGSGIQYRSRTGLPWRRARPGDNSINLDWMMTGPQSDFGFRVCPNGFAYTGRFYSEDTPLGIIAWRGQVVNSIARRSFARATDRALWRISPIGPHWAATSGLTSRTSISSWLGRYLHPCHQRATRGGSGR